MQLHEVEGFVVGLTGYDEGVGVTDGATVEDIEGLVFPGVVLTLRGSVDVPDVDVLLTVELGDGFVGCVVVEVLDFDVFDECTVTLGEVFVECVVVELLAFDVFDECTVTLGEGAIECVIVKVLDFDVDTVEFEVLLDIDVEDCGEAP